MKYLGIDYGTKKIGLAVSDVEGLMAYPNSVIRNDGKFLGEIDRFIHDEGIEAIVFGYSVNQKGDENKLMEEINDVIAQISLLHAVPVYLEQEGFTSTEARRSIDYGAGRRGNIANLRGGTKKNDTVDDKAAALILQRFLERQK